MDNSNLGGNVDATTEALQGMPEGSRVVGDASTPGNPKETTQVVHILDEVLKDSTLQLETREKIERARTIADKEIDARTASLQPTAKRARKQPAKSAVRKAAAKTTARKSSSKRATRRK